jgi:nicotinamidase-related amidase
MSKSYNSRATALIVTDMQREFDASETPEVIAACIREIKRAKKRKALILLVEYASRYYSDNGMSDTQDEILDVLEGYPHCITVSKKIDDGSAQIMKVLKRVGIPKRFKVCGVNTDCCVRSTVNGLTAKLPEGTQITLIADACNSSCSPFDEQYDEYQFGKYRNCVLKLSNIPMDTEPYDGYEDGWYDED